jgi:ABC-type nitrate/sulfonate/bicarbonate transport system substrate-binding protein
MKRVLKFAVLMTLWVFSAAVHAAQPDLIKLTVGYTPITAATLPFFIAIEESFFRSMAWRSCRCFSAARR